MFELGRVDEYIKILEDLRAETIVFEGNYQFGKTEDGCYYLDVFNFSKDKFVNVVEEKKVDKLKILIEKYFDGI